MYSGGAGEDSIRTCIVEEQGQDRTWMWKYLSQDYVKDLEDNVRTRGQG